MTSNITHEPQRNVIDFMQMDAITGNILNTTNFLDIDEFIRDARERSERTETENWN